MMDMLAWLNQRDPGIAAGDGVHGITTTMTTATIEITSIQDVTGTTRRASTGILSNVVGLILPSGHYRQSLSENETATARRRQSGGIADIGDVIDLATRTRRDHICRSTICGERRGIEIEA